MGRVLLVDDSRTMLAVLEAHLMGRGHDFATAADGREALGVAGRVRPHLIIADVMMPRMNGLELCRALQDDERLKATPFILVSSQWTDAQRMEALQLGAVACLDKPIEAEWLRRIVDRLVPPVGSTPTISTHPEDPPPVSRAADAVVSGSQPRRSAGNDGE